jgi:transposase
MSEVSIPPVRFVGLDVHKHSVMACIVDGQQHLLLPPRRMGLDAFEQWASASLQQTDAVVLEASINAWEFYDVLAPLVASVTVAHPRLVKLIAAARVKTDGRDALHLARLLAAHLIPAVWVPPKEVRELRALLAHRRRLIQQRTQARNRLHSLLHRHNLVAPAGEPFAAHQRAWWEALELRPLEALQVRQDLALLEGLAPLIGEVEAELADQSTHDPWVSQMPFLLQLPGLGVLTALTILAAMGDISRFPPAKKLVGYSGLGGRVNDSGDSHRTGGITTEGRRDLRGVLVEAAWIAVRHHPVWSARFERLAARIGKRKAIVAIARKLLVVVWHVLAHRVADRQAEVEAVGRKLLRWGATNRIARRQGLPWGAFTRQHLDSLGLGAELTSLVYGGDVYPLSRLEAAPSG